MNFIQTKFTQFKQVNIGWKISRTQNKVKGISTYFAQIVIFYLKAHVK